MNASNPSPRERPIEDSPPRSTYPSEPTNSPPDASPLDKLEAARSNRAGVKTLDPAEVLDGVIAQIAEQTGRDSDHPNTVRQAARLTNWTAENIYDRVTRTRPRRRWRDHLAPLSEVLALDLPAEDRWVIEDVIRGGTVNAVVGANKAGKSRVTLALVEALVTGRPFLEEFHVPRPVPVVVFANDDSTAELHRLMQDWAQMRGLGQEGEEAPLHLAANTDADLLDSTFLRDVAALIEEYDAKPVVVFDSLYNFTLGVDDNDRAAVKKVMDDVKRLCDDTGATVILIDHSAKDAGQGSHSMIGSQVKGARVRSGVNVTKLATVERDDGSFVTRVRLERWGNAGREWTREFEHDGVAFTWVRVQEVKTAAADDLRSRAEAALEEAGGSMPERELFDLLELPGDRPDRNLRPVLQADTEGRFGYSSDGERRPWTVRLRGGQPPI
jgi:AAA domain